MKTLFVFSMFFSQAWISLARGGETIMWYQQPAKAWHEALPVGNGRIGAMVFGGVEQERLQLNEQTVWSGNRWDYDRIDAFKHLPEAWSSGSVRGLCARGNVEVDLVWKGGQLQSATLRPGSDGELTIRYGDKNLTLKALAGRPIQVSSELNVMQ